ncbi:MAG: SMC-Scp complex subunit ScpB [Patescibacteria group bacterium]
MNNINMSAITNISALLFASGKPLSHAMLKRSLELSDEAYRSALNEMRERIATSDIGVTILETETEISLSTDPDVAETVQTVLKKDLSGELTKPSLEALAVIAYKGPVTKPEIEQIRGVNCSLILRNLLLRGLIEETGSVGGEARYSITIPFLQYLGVSSVKELPDYEGLNAHETLKAVLNAKT